MTTIPSGLYRDAVPGPAGLLFISGQVPVAPDGSTPESITEQTHLVFDHINALLAEHGADHTALRHVRYCLTDREDLAAFREVARERLPLPRPAATLAFVAGLVSPAFRIEIEAIAQLDQ